MGDSIRKTFENLVKKYEETKAADPADADKLLSGLLDDLHDEAADYWYWYSSSADC